MITKRLVALQAVLLAGFGALLLLPKFPERPAPGVNMNLPNFIGDWVGEDREVSQLERDTLGHETRFSRKSYIDSKGDEIFVSIVLAGQDMNTSIHRPERCLPAQGYTMLDSSIRRIPFTPHPLTITRLHNMHPPDPRRGPSAATEYSLDYYWFIGCTETTSSHIERNLIDVRDRLLKGYNQPWAFVTVVSRITKGLEKFGRSEEETDRMLQGFVKELVPVIEKPGVVKR